jgi:hypothetical protein
LPNVDEHTGHVLAHFLCTGTYQTLHNIEVSPEEETRVEFKRAFSAFVTANSYELAGLKRLAMHNIKQYGERMTIFDIVHAIDEDFSRLSDSMTDFQGYLKAKARDAFQTNHKDFHNNGVFDRISNVALSKALAKCVMELYEDKVTHMLQADRSTYDMHMKYDIMTEGDINREKNSSGDQDTGGVNSKSKEPKLGKGPKTCKKNEKEAIAGDAMSGDGDSPGDGGNADVGGSGKGGGVEDGTGEGDWGDIWGSKKSKKQLNGGEELLEKKENLLAKDAEEGARRKKRDGEDTAAVAATPPDDDSSAFAPTNKKKKKNKKARLLSCSFHFVFMTTTTIM